MSKPSVDPSASPSRLLRFAARAKEVLEVASQRPADQRLLPSIGVALVDQWISNSPSATAAAFRAHFQHPPASAPSDEPAAPEASAAPKAPAPEPKPVSELSFNELQTQLVEGNLTPDQLAHVDWNKSLPKMHRLAQIAARDALGSPLFPFEQQELDAMRAKLDGPGSDPHGEAIAAHAAAQGQAGANPSSFSHAPTGAPSTVPPAPKVNNLMWEIGEMGQVSSAELEASCFGTDVDASNLTMAEAVTSGI